LRTKDRTQKRASRAGFVLGALLAVVLLVSWRIPAGRGTSGFDLTLASGPTGELDVPPGPFLNGTGLRPGDSPAEGSLPIRNQTSVALSVAIRAVPSSQFSDDVVNIEVSTDAGVAFSGSLGDLRDWQVAFTLGPAALEELAFRAWVPAEAAGDFNDRIESVTIEFQATPTGAAG
jgi:hypothetical protein